MATFQQFKAFLDKIDPSDDLQFQEAVRTGTALLGITDKDLAERFDMSRPSVNRWKNGRNVPHPSMRKAVYSFLSKRIGRAIAAQQQQHDDDEEPTRASSPSFEPVLVAARSSR